MLKNNPHRPVILWLLSGCFLTYLMVVIGCITRLTHSGLSITDWSVMGSIPPMSAEVWQEHFSRYQQSPEYQQINTGMSLEEFKSIFFWEYLHRFIGRLIGGVFIIGFTWFLVKKKITRTLLPKMMVLVALGALQGLIGWWMVKSGLVNNPAVSHFRLATHLMSAFTVFAFTFWYALQLIYPRENNVASQGEKLHTSVVVLFVALIFQIIYGAFVAGLKAGLFYPTWPKMGNEWFPADTILTSGSLIKDFMENGAGVQFIHRTFAFVVVALVAWVWIRSNKLQLNKQQNRGVTFLIYGITVQFLLGIATLLYGVPVILGVLHQTGAFFLFASCVYLMYHLKLKRI
ncbi:MAG: COX15/CtaA family protein [Bacteroidia bacterium]